MLILGSNESAATTICNIKYTAKTQAIFLSIFGTSLYLKYRYTTAAVNSAMIVLESAVEMCTVKMKIANNM